MRKRIFALITVVMLIFMTLPAVSPSPVAAAPVPGDVTINKTAEWVDESNNIAMVTLAVDGVNTVSTTDVVLVIDRSGSMGWDLPGTGGTRLDAAKSAAIEFVNTLLADEYEDLNQIAVVSFGSAEYGAGEVTANIGLTGTTGRNSVISAINGLSASGGTTTQAGIQRADSILDGSTADNKVIVLLSDGQPTYSYRATAASPAVQGDWDLNYPTVNADGSALANKLTEFGTTRLGSGSSYYYFTGSYTIDGQYVNNNGLPTISQALIAKQQGYVIYTVGFALAGSTEGQYTMQYCASSADKYYETADDLSTVFAEIAGSIIDAGRDAVIEDIMGYGFSPDYEWELIKPGDPDYAGHGISVSRGTYELSVVDPTPPGVDKITWNLGTITEETATLTYYVRLKPTSLFSGSDMPLDTNSEAIITYENYLNETITTPFPEPALSCPLGSIQVSKIDQYEDPLTGAGFTLYSNEACTDVVGTEQFVTANPTTLFSSMVPGTYYMKETTPAPNCEANPNVYKVVVTIDESEPPLAVVSVYVKVGDTYQPVALDEGVLVIENILQEPSIDVTKTADPTTYDEVGDVITYTVTIENDGNVSLTNVSLNDTLVDVSGVIPVESMTDDDILEVGETWTYTYNYTITQGDLDAGQVDNTATGSAYFGEDKYSDSDDETVTATQEPSIDVTKDADVANYDEVGDVITYTVTIENDGNVSLTNVSLNDTLVDVSGVIPVESMTDDDILEVGETWTYTYNYTITQDDLDVGQVDNTATGSAYFGEDEYSDWDDETVTATQEPSIDVTKDADVANYDEVGDVITYTVTIENDGNVSLTNVSLNDTLVDVSGVTATESMTDDDILEVGETWTYTYNYTITQDDLDAGQVDNTATGFAYFGETEYSDWDDETVTATQEPSIDVTKDADVANYDEVGDVITYTVTIENDGNVSLTNVSLNDTLVDVSGVTATESMTDDDILEVGETWTYTYNYTITQGDLDAGQVDNTATGSAYFGEDKYSDSDDETVTATQAPSLDVTKTADPTTYDEVGDVITYTVTIENDGNVSLDNVSLNDTLVDASGVTATESMTDDDILEIGEAWIYTYQYTITQGDLDAGQVDNTATGSAYFGEDEYSDSDDETVTATQEPSIDVTKDADVANYDEVGDVITYTVTIENDDNVSLDNVSLNDTLVDVSLVTPTGDNGNGILDPGETWTYTYNYTITQDDLDVGQVDNTATGSAYFGETEYSDWDDETVTATQEPSIDVTKDADPTTYDTVGQNITYTVTIHNEDNVNLTNVSLNDTLVDVSLVTPTGDNGNGILDPGETWTYTYNYTITQDDLDVGQVDNTATGSAYFGEDEYTDSDDETVTRAFPRPPAGGGGGGCPTAKYLTVDWEGNNTTEPLYSNDKLAVDLLGPSPDLSNRLLLERGTHAPVVGRTTYYLIVIRELEEIPAPPENTVALVAFNITPPGAEFDRDIFLTLGLDELQLPENALNVTMAYYDDVNDVWVFLESEVGGPNGVAELTLSAPINHFSIFGVLAELAPTPPQPAHFVASGLSIAPSVEKIWELVTFVTKTGESVTITANVANDGGQEGTYTVVLKLNGETVDTKIVTVGAGQSQPVSFTVSGLDYGQYEVEVAGLSGEFTASRTITWWLIIVIIAAIGLIIWGVVWGRRRRKAAQQEA